MTPTPSPLPQPIITRIDFFEFNESLYTGRDRTGWRVVKYAEGWTAHTPPVAYELDPPIRTSAGPHPFDIDTALALLAQAGWIIRRWPHGARAWKGSPAPVRTRAAILEMRARADNALARLDADGLPWRADFAYDL